MKLKDSNKNISNNGDNIYTGTTTTENAVTTRVDKNKGEQFISNV